MVTFLRLWSVGYQDVRPVEGANRLIQSRYRGYLFRISLRGEVS